MIHLLSNVDGNLIFFCSLDNLYPCVVWCWTICRENSKWNEINSSFFFSCLSL